MNTFRVNNLTFSYPNGKILFSKFNLTAQSGDIVHIKGKNGAGKTTLLKIFCGVIPKIIKGNLQGNVLINNTDLSSLTLPQTSLHASMTFQEPEKQLLLPDVESELAFAPENLALNKSEIENRIKNALDLLHISDIRFREVTKLSYGQKKLVAFASIITLSPIVFLLDEPFAGLSVNYQKIITETIKYLSKKGKIIIFTDHNISNSDFVTQTIEL